MRLRAGLMGALLAALPSIVLAHSTHTSGGVRTSLEAELPGVAMLVVALAVPYASGVRRLWDNAGRGSGVSVLEAASFGSGLGVLTIALLGPVFVPLTDEFSGHMTQHIALIAAAAPLLAFGHPELAYSWWARGVGLSGIVVHTHRLTRRQSIRYLLNAPALLFMYVATLWIWHIPALYHAATQNELLHMLEHASMLALAGMFWCRVRTLRAGNERRQVTAFFLLFAVMFPELALGAYVTFAREPLYEAHRLATEARGGDPLADQQVGGLVMLMIGGMTYAGVALAGLLRLLSRAPGELTTRSEHQ